MRLGFMFTVERKEIAEIIDASLAKIESLYLISLTVTWPWLLDLRRRLRCWHDNGVGRLGQVAEL